MVGRNFATQSSEQDSRAILCICICFIRGKLSGRRLYYFSAAMGDRTRSRKSSRVKIRFQLLVLVLDRYNTAPRMKMLLRSCVKLYCVRPTSCFHGGSLVLKLNLNLIMFMFSFNVFGNIVFAVFAGPAVFVLLRQHLAERRHLPVRATGISPALVGGDSCKIQFYFALRSLLVAVAVLTDRSTTAVTFPQGAAIRLSPLPFSML